MKFLSKILDFFKEKEESHPWYDLYEGGSVPSIDYPRCTMVELVEQTAKNYPFHTAYTYFGKKCSYTKFIHQIHICAKALKKLGVKKDDRVTICMPNTPEAIIVFYAVNLIGGVSNMIHPLSSEKEIEFYLNKSKSKYVLCLNLLYSKVLTASANTKVEKIIVSNVSASMPSIMRILYNLTQKRPKIVYDEKTVKWATLFKSGMVYSGEYRVAKKAKDDAMVLYSGGTTGDPKGAVISNLNMNALGMQSFKMTDPAKAGESVLTIMPIFHGFGIGVCVHTSLISGMNTILVPQFKPQEFSKLIKKNKPQFLAGVPTMYEALINSKEKSKNYLKSVSTVICGGDILNETLRDQVDKYLKEHGSEAKIRVGYGLTECTGASCLTPRYYYKEGGIGIPFPDTIYKIVRLETLEKADVDEVGEICINGPTVMKRYLDDVEETKKVLKYHNDGKLWLHTGDVGYMTKDGLVFFASRLKRMIVSSGYNIYPQYIEKNIMSHPAVLSCTVVGVPHKYRKQVPKAFIILRENFDNTEELRANIKKHCEKNIAKYALPYEYEYVDDLPKTKVGKVAFTKLMEKEEKENGKKKN